MYEDTPLYINRTQQKEDIAMQTENALEKTIPNCRFISWLWRHHGCNHYHDDVIRVTRISANLYSYYFIIKCNLAIKILQHGKNTKNLKLVQNYIFPKILRYFQQNSHCWTKFLRIYQMDTNSKSQKQSPQQFILFEIL